MNRRLGLPTAVALVALAGCVAPAPGPEPAGALRPGARAAARPQATPGPQVTGSAPLAPTTPAPGALPLVGPLAPAAGIIGKLKAGPASLIANNAATLVSDRGSGLVANNGGGLAGAYRLLALEEAPVAGAEVRLVDATGQPLTAEVATTDATGAFTLQRPDGLADALVQAAFTAAGQPVTYMATLPASGPLDVDTATTLAAARWQLDKRAGRP
ncbi:MAG: hypothetical protein VKS61_08875, partial [Candidatus Sericytochromatia bacterium]|nr:hypothetical protein [Candidatus Sericytochromatia bacterium]